MANLRLTATLSLTAAVLLVGCESPLARDLEAYCAIVHEVRTSTELPPPKKDRLIEKRAAAEIPGEAFEALHAKIVAAEPDGRYAILQQAADDEGMSMWTCFDARSEWEELGQHQRLAAFDAAQAKSNGKPSGASKKATKKKKKKRKKRR